MSLNLCDNCIEKTEKGYCQLFKQSCALMQTLFFNIKNRNCKYLEKI